MTRVIRTAAILSIAGMSLSAHQQTTSTFRARTEAVAVPVLVRDGNHAVTGLTASDFELRDSGVVQSVNLFALSSVPIDVTLLMDASSSVSGPALAQFKADIQAMSDQLDRADRIRLLTFADATRDVFGLQPAGTRLPLDAVTGRGTTALYDALAGGLIVAAVSDRPQLMMAFTDGVDSASLLDGDRLTALAGLSSESLYLVLAKPADSAEHTTVTTALGTEYHGHGMYAGGPNRSALRAVAEATGGTLYESASGESLPVIFKKLLADFRTGYVLSFSPTGVPPAGWHDLQVRVKNPAYTVKARSGYNRSQ